MLLPFCFWWDPLRKWSTPKRVVFSTRITGQLRKGRSAFFRGNQPGDGDTRRLAPGPWGGEPSHTWGGGRVFCFFGSELADVDVSGAFLRFHLRSTGRFRQVYSWRHANDDVAKVQITGSTRVNTPYGQRSSRAVDFGTCRDDRAKFSNCSCRGKKKHGWVEGTQTSKDFGVPAPKWWFST